MPESDLAIESFAERTLRVAAGPCDLYLLPTPVDRVVSFAGSIRTAPDFISGDSLRQDLMSMLLDKGTRKRDRFAIADLIDNRGAQLSFRSNGNRIVFSGRALRDDLEEVIGLLAEQLREPRFDPEEFVKAKARLHSEIQRSMEETGSQAVSALTRQIYQPQHPNYQYPPEAELEALALLAVEDVITFHRDHVGARDLTLVLVGDVAAEVAEARVRAAFSGWEEPPSAGGFDPHGFLRTPDRVSVPVPDKQNVDVRMGHALRLRRDDDDYLPLFLGIFALGGNFSSRLMTVVRDTLGLTYGISSQVVGMTTEYDGYVRTAVTLSPENVDRGVEATRKEIVRMVEEGISEEELAATKTTITGSFVVDLATTGGLAFSILVNVLRHFGVSYLDRFPSLIERVTREDVNAALRRYIRPDAQHVVVAGAI